MHWLTQDEYAHTLIDVATDNQDEADKKHIQLLQRYALATIYYGTSQYGPWSACAPTSEESSPCDNDEHRYLSPSNHLSWEGINGKGGLITWLDLNTKNLSNCRPSTSDNNNHNGEYDMFPLELSLLSPSLELLWLHSNPFLCGSLPSYIGEFINLQSLSLYSTNMSGPLPQSLYTIDKLASIRLYKSNFGGSISPELNQMKNLKWFWIHENQFEGTLPNLGKLNLLEGVTLHGNALDTSQSGLCQLLKASLKYLWTDCNNHGVVKKGQEWVVVEGEKACECCTRCFPKKQMDAVAVH
jgi:hypothetical protein